MSIINTIINDDVILGLKAVPDEVVSLICTSPPYNVAANKWSYATASDDQPYADYIKWLADVFKECYRTLRKGGRLVINIDAMTNRQDDKEEQYIRDIRTDLANVLRPMCFKFFGEHIWYKSALSPEKNGGQFNGKKTAWGSYKSCSSPAVRRNHEYILVYSKEQFRLDKDADSLDPDISGVDFEKFIASTWSMNAETRNLGDHPVPFPVELPLRCIKLYSYPNDVVMDPFNGVGTTTYVAYKTGRRYIGIDMDKDYCVYAEERIASKDSDVESDLFKLKPEKKTKRQIEAERCKDAEDNFIL